MQTINIRIEVSGSIAAQLPDDLDMQCLSHSRIGDVLEYVGRAYPHAYAALDRCLCVIGGEVKSLETVIEKDIVIVLQDVESQIFDMHHLDSHHQKNQFENNVLFSNESLKLHSTDSYLSYSQKIDSHSMVYQWHI